MSASRAQPLARARRRLRQHFGANQVLGRRNAIGCVALEITQRCNLDCTLCYLSENSARVKDIPLEEVTSLPLACDLASPAAIGSAGCGFDRSPDLSLRSRGARLLASARLRVPRTRAKHLPR